MLISDLVNLIREVFSASCGYGVAMAEGLVAIEALEKQEEEGTER